MSVGSANGTKLHYETAVTGVWQECTHMVDFSGWGSVPAEVDVSDLSSTGFKAKVPGLKDPGTGQHTIRMDLEEATQFAAVFDMANADPPTTRRWALEYPDRLHGGSDDDIIYGAAYPAVTLSGGVDTPADWSLALTFTGVIARAAALPS